MSLSNLYRISVRDSNLPICPFLTKLIFCPLLHSNGYCLNLGSRKAHIGPFCEGEIINKPLHHCMQVKFFFFQTTPGLFYIRTLIWYLGMNVIKLQSNIFQVIFCLFSYDITCVLLSCKSIAAKQNLMQLLPVLINIVHNRLIDKSDHKLDGFWLSHLAVLVHSFFASHLVTQLYSSCNPAVFIL